MIRQPRVGQQVRVHYPGPGKWTAMPYHGKAGVVRCLRDGPFDRNVGVEIDGKLHMMSRWHLMAIRSRKETP